MKPQFRREFRSWPLVAIICLLFLTNITYPVQAQRNDNWAKRLEHKAHRIGEFYYVGLQQVAEALGTHTYYSNKVRKAILYVGDAKITVTAFNPFVLVGSRVLQMPTPAKYDKNDIQLPVKFFLPLLQQVVRGEIDVDSPAVANRTLPVNIEGVSVEDKANGTLIRVRTLAKFKKSSLSTRYSRRWLYVDILGGSIDPKTFVALDQSDLVKKIVPIQMTQMVQLSFRLGHEIDIADLKIVEKDGELLLSIPGTGHLSSSMIERLKNDQEKWRINTIIIDPGHGGRDPGTIGQSGVKEKDVVLGIAKRLKRLLSRKMKVKVLMTRDDDKYISLKERTQFANKNNGKLFISIHANWNRNSSVTGAATYFLGLAKTDEALEISQRENAVIHYDDGDAQGELNDEQIILASMAQNSYNKESQDFAAMIQQEIGAHTKLRDRGIKQAGFYVMVGASMPNVLIETGFMSNKHEERMIKSAKVQNKIADAIYRSVKKFKEKYEWNARSGS